MLQHLVMNFEACHALSDVSSIGSALNELKMLQHLVMNFEACQALSDVSSIGNGLRS